MRTNLVLSVAALLLLLPSCSLPTASAHVGYAQLAVDGNLGYVSGTTTASVRQDVRSAFGLGDDRGVPYGKATVGWGVPQLSVSAFKLSDHGDGVLSANFGNNPNLTAGAPVHTDLDLTNVKGSLAFQIPLGPVSLSPGIGVDYFDLTVQVRDQIGIATERVELNAPIPIAFLRGEADLGVASLIAEAGYSAVNVKQVDGNFLDLEAMVVFHPAPLIDLFAGYRSMQLKVNGTIDNNNFDTDLTISGFLVGGGVRF